MEIWHYCRCRALIPSGKAYKNIFHEGIDKTFYTGERGGINVWLQKYLLSSWNATLPVQCRFFFFYFTIIITEMIAGKNKPVCSKQQIEDFQDIETTPPGLPLCLLCHHAQLCCPHHLPHHHNELLQLLSSCLQHPPFNICYTCTIRMVAAQYN